MDNTFSIDDYLGAEPRVFRERVAHRIHLIRAAVAWGLPLVIVLLLLQLVLIVLPSYTTGIHRAYLAGVELGDQPFVVPGYDDRGYLGLFLYLAALIVAGLVRVIAPVLSLLVL